MRLGTTIAVTVLATGVICGGAALAADPPPAGQSKIDGAGEQVKTKPKTPVGLNPWRQAELKPEHDLLKNFVGHWTTNVHSFVGHFAKARDTEGTADGKLLMGGRFVQVTQSETRMKLAFEALTTLGFNEALGKYTADVIDTAGAQSVRFTGTYDAATKKLTMTTRYSEGKTTRLTIKRTVTTFLDDKMWTFEEFVSHGVGEKESPTVAITFKKS